jgi:hypothetical protein
MAGGGRFAVTVADTGVEPVPVRGLRFPDRESAVVAARLTTAYRASLKRWDPETVLRDQVVRERMVGSDEGGSPSAAPPSTSERAHTGGER